MNKNKENGHIVPYSEIDINWNELQAIGVTKEELQESGQLEQFLNGEPTGIMHLSFTVFESDIELYATLQLVRKDGSVQIEINSISPEADPFSI